MPFPRRTSSPFATVSPAQTRVLPARSFGPVQVAATRPVMVQMRPHLGGMGAPPVYAQVRSATAHAPAPPPYRPGTSPPNSAAPPVYRPPSAAVTCKMAAPFYNTAGSAPARYRSAGETRAAAPPVYRPGYPAISRSIAHSVGRLLTGPSTSARPAAPPVYRPSFGLPIARKAATPGANPLHGGVSPRIGIHSLRSTPVPHGAGVVLQRQLLKKNGEAYTNIARAPWYKELNPNQQTIAKSLHGISDSIKYDDILARIAAEEKKSSVPPTLVSAPTGSNAPLFASAPVPGNTPSTGGTPAIVAAPAFSGRIEFGAGGYNSEDVSDDDDEDATPDEANKHWQKKIISGLEQSKKRTLKSIKDDDSSDSEIECGTDLGRQKKRRKYKGDMLVALATQALPLTANEIAFSVGLQNKRSANNKNRKGKRQMQDRASRQDHATIGLQFSLTSCEHNPNLRRAFREAVSVEKIEEGGSGNYELVQGKVRTALKKIIAKDHEEMKWSRADFADDRTWLLVKTLIDDVMSNSSKVDSLFERLESGQDITGASHRVAFHHVAWKEAMKGAFSEYAVCPGNLVALNDLRELLNASKIKKIVAAGGTLPEFGSHDKLGHQGYGFRSDQQKEFTRSRGGGQFKDIDLEGAYYVLKPLLKPRTPKAKLYS
jgi:hypothetical protein